MTHFHIGHNMPGYLPESEIYCTSDPAQALAVWRADVRDAIEQSEDDAEYLDTVVTVSDVLSNGTTTMDIGEYTYWIEPVATPIQDCEWQQDGLQ